MSNANLVDLNSATLGAKMPEITLPDGSKVQTGTIGALLVNIRAYNQAHTAGHEAKLAQLENAIRMAIPLLKRVGMLDLFSPEEWMQGNNEGRKLVGKLVLESDAQ